MLSNNLSSYFKIFQYLLYVLFLVLILIKNSFENFMFYFLILTVIIIMSLIFNNTTKYEIYILSLFNFTMILTLTGIHLTESIIGFDKMLHF